MTLPYDIVSKAVIPYLRALVAKALDRAGLSQGRIAYLLSVSQPMVSKYLGMEEPVIRDKLLRAGVPPDELSQVIDELATSLINGDLLRYIKLFTAYVNSLLSRGLLCRTHLEVAKGLPQDCDICASLFSGQADFLVEEANEIFRRIRSLRRAALLIPEVGMNIVVATPNATSVMDTVGFSGRIFRVGANVKAVGPAVRGGSKHTAKVLLEVVSRLRDIRYCVVVRYSEDCVDAIERNYEGVLVIESHRNEEELLRELRKRLSEFKGELSAVVDLGGPGLEAVTYIFGRSPNDLISKVRTCAGENT